MNPFDKMKLKKETFTKKELVIYNLLYNNTDLILRRSATDLSTNHHVSQSTITRFCQKLGYDGFNEFKFDVFRNEKQVIDKQENNVSSIDMYIKIFQIIKHSLDYSQLAKLAHDIINAQSIIIIGYHKSALPSKMLQFNLFKIHKKAMYISQDEIHELPNIIQENDILIAFSNDGNGLEAIKNEIKSEKQEKQFNLSIITMNDKLSLKKLSDNYVWLPSSTNQGFEVYLENQIIFFLYVDLLTSEITEHI